MWVVFTRFHELTILFFASTYYMRTGTTVRFRSRIQTLAASPTLGAKPLGLIPHDAAFAFLNALQLSRCSIKMDSRHKQLKHLR